jgi:predicted NUDIX family NTP pyrophosphohydrolase
MEKREVVSAGLLMCRRGPTGPECLLAHPGGPYFARKDEGAWTLPKGRVEADEEPLAAAQREFAEETGFAIGACAFFPLGSVVLKSHKRVHGWAFAGNCDPSGLHSNSFELEWPPRSGKMRAFPEVDRVAFFAWPAAYAKLAVAQHPFLERALAFATQLR